MDQDKDMFLQETVLTMVLISRSKGGSLSRDRITPVLGIRRLVNHRLYLRDLSKDRRGHTNQDKVKYLGNGCISPMFNHF